MSFNSETVGATTVPTTAGKVSIDPARAARLAALREAAAEVFATMVGAIVVPETTDFPVLAYVTGVLGITGAMNAVFTLRCSEAAAIKIASKMLAVSAEEAAQQKFDAIGEVCNMVAGHFKHKIGFGDKCMLTVPTVVTGGNYRIHSLAAVERLEFPVLYEGEPLWLALDIRQ